MPDDPAVLTRTLPVDPSSLEDIRTFVDDHLARAGMKAGIGEVASDAVARVAGPNPAGVVMTVRVFDDHLEVEVSVAPVGVRAATTHESFGRWLAGILRTEGLSQEAAARRIGVSLKTVNRWIRGHSEPRLRELRRVSDAFGDPPIG